MGNHNDIQRHATILLDIGLGRSICNTAIYRRILFEPNSTAIQQTDTFGKR